MCTLLCLLFVLVRVFKMLTQSHCSMNTLQVIHPSVMNVWVGLFQVWAIMSSITTRILIPMPAFLLEWKKCWVRGGVNAQYSEVLVPIQLLIYNSFWHSLTQASIFPPLFHPFTLMKNTTSTDVPPSGSSKPLLHSLYCTLNIALADYLHEITLKI